MKAVSIDRMRFIFLLFCTIIAGCERSETIKFAGEAQGTTYHITVAHQRGRIDAATLQNLVDARLREIDMALSNYRDDSELSRFNRASVGAWIDLSRDLYAVLQVSNRISVESDGAFDITVAPLVDLWGFGPIEKTKTVPARAQIDAARALVGYANLELDPAQPRVKKLRALTIDVNGIAQGYSVDAVAAVLSAQGCTDFLVEIGGELRLIGFSPDGKPWRIGIEKPVDGVVSAQQAVMATGVGITTAGDYHDYFEKDGVRYSHTIDPRTGAPIAHNLASVTVVAPTAVLADGYDTALEVMGLQQGFAFAEKKHLAAYFIVRTRNGFSVTSTAEMKRYLDEPL